MPMRFICETRMDTGFARIQPRHSPLNRESSFCGTYGSSSTEGTETTEEIIKDCRGRTALLNQRLDACGIPMIAADGVTEWEPGGARRHPTFPDTNLCRVVACPTKKADPFSLYFFSDAQGKFTNRLKSIFTCSSGISISDSLRKRMK